MPLRSGCKRFGDGTGLDGPSGAKGTTGSARSGNATRLLQTADGGDGHKKLLSWVRRVRRSFSRQLRDFYGRVTRRVWGVKAIRPLSCVIAISLLVIAFPAWSECTQPDRTPTSRYVIKGGEVYDTQTRLTWARCSVGQVWTEGEGCVGTVRSLTFEQAKLQVDAIWRLPTGKELVTLVAFCQHPAINAEVFPGMNMPLVTLYWTDDKNNNEFPSVVDFYFGGPTVLNRAQTAAVRLVLRQ